MKAATKKLITEAVNKLDTILSDLEQINDPSLEDNEEFTEATEHVRDAKDALDRVTGDE